MTRPLTLLMTVLMTGFVAKAQLVTYHFTDGSVVTHAITDVRSSAVEDGSMLLYLWDGTVYTWSQNSLSSYEFTDLSTAVPVEPMGLAPVQVFPNPSSGAVHIGLVADGSDHVEVTVVDQRGGLVSTVRKGRLPVGKHTLVWDGRDDEGRPVAGGTYLVRVVQGPRAATRQLIVLH